MQTKSKARKLARVRVGPSFRRLTSTLFACDVESMAKHYTKIANRFIAANGPKWTCSRLKGYYNIGCKLALELNVENIPFCKTIGKDNIPRDMIPFLPYLKSPNINHRRACLTVLRSYTQIYDQVSTDTESIEAYGPQELLFQNYQVNFNKICEKYKLYTKPYIRDEGLYTTSKTGPNGHAMLNVDKDFAAIRETNILATIKELNAVFEEVCIKSTKAEVSLSSDFCPDFDAPPEEDMISYAPRTVRKENMYKAMENFIQWRVNNNPNCYDNVYTSRICHLAEGGCKTRTIAIGDYFTQDCLKPLHKSLYRVLRQLETDGTSSHNRIAQLVKEKTLSRSTVRSYDLTAATDRFPIFIQERALSVMYGTKVSTAWRKLMVDREFHHAESKRLIRYGYGQPMGLLSSWATFALTHHIIVETCAAQRGLKGFKDYVVIGDDVTIFNDNVADEYEVFLKTFNIQISEAKSLRSGGNPSSAEIAKRLFINGNEISPIPYDAIESAIKNYLLFPNLIKLCSERDVKLDITFQEPVQSALLEVFKRSTTNKILTLLSSPISGLPKGISRNMWEEVDESLIHSTFNEVRKNFIASKAKDLYQNELSSIPDMGVLGEALESSNGPDLLNLHPLFVLLRAYRDRCGSIYQGILIKGISPSDLELIPFLVNPMIPNYIRRTHQVEKVRSSLILETYKLIQQTQANSSC
jgi:hypothetical protein